MSDSTQNAKKNKGSKETLQCLQCPYTTTYKHVLGAHLRAKHNVLGTAYSSVYARNKKLPAPLPVPVLKTPVPEKVKVQCPHCDLFFFPKGLALHLSRMHKQQNQIISTNPKQGADQNEGSPSHQTGSVGKTLPISNRSPEEAGDPLAYAIAVGQVKELCRHIAEEHGVPTKLFTAQFAQIFLRQARG